ncbi:PREDICTED: uncharacterized protein LOC105149793 [Acromyrmex echinatior]|uniref:uncharacterized protein LOC105149793 n=1 Tax=Acromyrmex echinatior TaxID=103372 RepID=UPI000580F090|nr:PREDICTED: uncharacterized protein LOC105149793 [Acromyrmex echinatior]
MDFQNVNPLNVRLNIISGNLLPITSDGSSFHITWRIYTIIIWIIELFQTCATICGFVLVANRETLQNAGTVSIVLSIEVFILLTRMYASKDLASQLIQKLNSVMHSGDETMKNIVHSTLKPLEIPLEFYCIAGTGSVIVWCSMPLILIFKKKSFFYEDFGMMAAFSKQPFSTKVFVLGNLIETVASAYIFLKKVALNVYMINLVLLLTAQYRYIAIKLAAIFHYNTSQNEGHEFQKENYSQATQCDTVIILFSFNINKQQGRNDSLCYTVSSMSLAGKHHITTLILKKFLSFNMSLIYLNNIFLFCFVDIVFINAVYSQKRTHERTYFLSLWNMGSVLIVYLCGALIQLYILCFCVHQLLEASKELTDKAFHEKWYQFGPSLKHIFRMIMVSNNLKTKLSISEKFNLSLPSFLAILNQSYSIAILLLKVK